jgi:hypothetical protein
MRYTKRHIESLNDDELSMLWFMVNIVNPKIVNYELSPELFTSIKYADLKNRILQCEQFIKDEYKSVYNELKRKMELPYDVPPIVEIPA